MLDLQTLKFFTAVAREGSFSGAAQKLNCAQSNLSTKIKNLENELHTELFYRNSFGVTLTDKGNLLLEYADKLLNIADEAQNVISENNIVSQSLRIGAMESVAITFLPELLNQYHKNFPQIHMSVETCISKTAFDKILNHSLDGAFVAGNVEHEEIHSKLVRYENLVLITNIKNKNESQISNLLSLPILVLPNGCSYRRIFENFIEETGRNPTKIIEFQSLTALLASVCAGLGVALFPRDSIKIFADKNLLCCHEIPSKYGHVSVKFIWRKNNWSNVSLQNFIQLFDDKSNENPVAT